MKVSKLANAAKKIPKFDPSIVNKIFKNGISQDDLWAHGRETIKFFQKVKEKLNNKGPKITISKEWKQFEYLSCFPDDPLEACFSSCERHGEDYTWCKTSHHGHWDHCQCTIRPEIKKWIIQERRKLMAIVKKPVMETETILWILVGVLSSTIFTIASLITGRYFLRKFRIWQIKQANNQEFLPGQQ